LQFRCEFWVFFLRHVMLNETGGGNESKTTTVFKSEPRIPDSLWFQPYSSQGSRCLVAGAEGIRTAGLIRLNV
jgi:hypothetical protein